VIVGHTRLEASKMLKLKKVPVHVADLTAKQAREYRIADNSVGSKSVWDRDLLALELEDLAGGFDMSDFGLDFVAPGDPQDLNSFSSDAVDRAPTKIVLRYSDEDFEQVQSALAKHGESNELALLNLLGLGE
jgi:hypothetical protein